MATQNSKMSKKKRQDCVELGRKTIRISVFLLCLGGFSYQTIQFLNIYWAHPTVMDIQEISPSYLDMPAITICNPIGYNYTGLCSEHFGGYICDPVQCLENEGEHYCKQDPSLCVWKRPALDFTYIEYNKFLGHLKYLSYEDHDKLRVKLEDYMNCTIQLDGSSKSCNMENVMGSFYTQTHMPQYCYTIYSLWGQPDKKIDRIPKQATMKLHFFLNASDRADKRSPTFICSCWFPLHNIPSSPFVQMAVHSPYFLPSPYLKGSNYHGGKSYELRLTTMINKHLLPHPYQTNCTDYTKVWARNGGRGPINQLGVLQECIMKKYYELLGCVPVFVDYPHTFRICNTSVSDNADMTASEIECSMHADQFHQPCESTSYLTTERVLPGSHDCLGDMVWEPKCSTVDIEFLFNTLVIKNITYNAKFESIEIFSVIGGYIGLWVGISLVTVYDFIESVLGYIKDWGLEKHRRIRARKDSLVFFSKKKRGPRRF